MKNIYDVKKYLVATLIISQLIITVVFAQKNTTVTITNQNLGLVKEERELKLEKGRQTVNLEAIPALINPASVLIESDFNVLEQNFEYDLISVDKMLEKSLEKDVIIDHPQQGRMSGKLLSANSANLILKTADGITQIIPRNNQQKISLTGLDEVNQPFIVRPTLIWDVLAQAQKTYNTKISYLSTGFNWNADYVALLNENDTRIILSGWVTINNTSGKTFKETKLKLMAGDLNLVKPENRMRFERLNQFNVAKEASAFEEKALFEYHIYDLQRKTDLKNNQIKQIQLFDETDAKIKKIYRINSYNPTKVAVIVSFKNSKENNLGMPLPKGIIRLYKKDGEEREFVGENRIEHTPKNETLDIEVGAAFDIVSERAVKDVKRPDKKTERRTVEYKIRNHKDDLIQIEIVESIPRYAEIEKHTANGKLIQHYADYLKYVIEVPANDEFIFNLEYSLRY